MFNHSNMHSKIFEKNAYFFAKVSAKTGFSVKGSELFVLTPSLREAAKKCLLLMAKPLRPYPPPPSVVMAIELFFVFFCHKIAGNGV